VKVYRGSPGMLEVAGRARGHMESWQKWSFPCRPPSQGGEELAGRRPVSKRRRIGVDVGVDHFRSYAEWLWQRSGGAVGKKL
jgi:hypothetical protein